MVAKFVHLADLSSEDQPRQATTQHMFASRDKTALLTREQGRIASTAGLSCVCSLA